MHRSPYTLAEIAQVLSAEWSPTDESVLIEDLIFDSRKISNPAQSLFFALKGKKDGHLFIEDAYRAGVRNFVTDKQNRYQLPSKARCLAVDDVQSALQALAQYHREHFSIPVIAITGSNGKTVVKEWLNQLLSPDYTIVRSPKSYNSQIGVALSLWQIRPRHNLAIIEAGISKPGEMERLRQMIQPTRGILTNIGPAHDSNFASREEKTIEKLRLFANTDSLVFSPSYVPDALLPNVPARFTWDLNLPADLKLSGQRRVSRGTLLTAQYKGEELSLTIPFYDHAAIENAVSCWAMLLSMGYRQEVVAERMARLSSVEMRLELKKGIDNCSIIDDSYSFDLASLEIALNFLKQQNQHHEKILILSDVPEAEGAEKNTYQQLAGRIKNAGISRLIGIGPRLSEYRTLFPENSLFFPDTYTFLRALPDISCSNATILLKGARSFAFETISKRLTLKTHDTALHINLNALEHNLKYYQSRLADGTKLMVMVKAFSYGSGSFEVANVLQFNKVDYLAVAYGDEGIALRKSGITLPIMVMSPDIHDFEALIEHNLEPEIFTVEHLKSLLAVLKSRSVTRFPIHLKIETGMHRLGIEERDYVTLLHLLKDENSIQVKSVFSHFAAADESRHDAFTREQIHRLKAFTEKLNDQLPYTFLTHISNTAGIDRWPEARFDMVRLGIGLYGIGASNRHLLEPAASLVTTISQIKEVSGNDTVGYGRKGRISGGGTIAVVRVGYADGYNRRLGNGVGQMMVGGTLVPTVGEICMDMCMIDVSGLPVEVGDEVIVFGESPRIEELAERVGTIPYEIMTGISQRVKRIYYSG